MKRNSIAKGLLVTVLCILSIGAAHIPAKATDKTILNEVYKLDKKYKTMSCASFTADFDQDGQNESFLVLTKKTAAGDDVMGIGADLCLYDNGKVTLYKASDSQGIVPNSFGVQKLNGKAYFRYDLAYATDSQTKLVSVKNGKPYEAFVAPGSAVFGTSSSFTVVCSSYDLVKMKSDDFSTGHTWKAYYFYVDQIGFHEYKARKISEKDFLYYKGSADILKKIKKEFGGKYLKYELQYLQRSNGMIHINIALESEDSIEYRFKTYRLEKKTLKPVEAGDGNYLPGITSQY